MENLKCILVVMHMYKTQTKIKTNKKNIIVIGTGGTIAGIGEEGETVSYDAAQIKVDKLVSEVPTLTSLANLTSENMFNVDSCDMTFDKLIKLAKYINQEAKKDDVDGFVITHGTDTLEETAYFLNLVLNTDKPVVLTGSMRPNTATSADGPLNLYQAVALANNDEAKGKGVLVVFSDGIYSARDVTKINTFRTDAFNQKDLGCLGYMRDDKVFFFNASTKLHTTKSEFNIENMESLPKVTILMFYVDAEKDLLDYVSKNCQGIVLAGAGCGCSSTIWNNIIAKVMESGVPVVRSSRIGNGLVTYPESEIPEKGICAGNLSPQKARILLSLALAQTNDIPTIQEIFKKY